MVFLLHHYSGSRGTNAHKNEGRGGLSVSPQFLEVQRCLGTNYFLYFWPLIKLHHFNYLRVSWFRFLLSVFLIHKYLHVVGFFRCLIISIGVFSHEYFTFFQGMCRFIINTNGFCCTTQLFSTFIKISFHTWYGKTSVSSGVAHLYHRCVCCWSRDCSCSSVEDFDS